MVEVKNLTKHYGDKKAVDNINFSVNAGEILGFLGPNGAGKSTTMNMLTGFISSSSGSAVINGVDILEEPIKAKSFIGYLPELPPLYVDMTVRSYLNFIYDLKRCKMPRIPHIDEVCRLTKIEDMKHRVIKHLSKGYRQRVGLAQALIGNPPVLILDEPTVGLDPKQIIEIRSLIKKLGKSHTVILSSHILSEIQAVCDRIVIINKGVIAADDTADNLARNISGDHRLVVRVEGAKSDVISTIRKVDKVKYIRADMEREPGVYEYEIEAADGRDIRRDLNKILAANDMPILAMRTSDMTLEDVFLKITMGQEFMFSEYANREAKEEDSKADAVRREVEESIGFDNVVADSKEVVVDDIAVPNEESAAEAESPAVEAATEKEAVTDTQPETKPGADNGGSKKKKRRG